MFAIANYSLRIWGGFIPFVACSILGALVFLRGFRGEVLDSCGMETAPRSWFIVVGLLLQFPLIAFIVYLWKQGLFES